MNDSNRTARSSQQPGTTLPLQRPTTSAATGFNTVLGQGGFGIVYLAYDDQLQRLVAIKVPHRKLVSRPEDAEAYLTEARTVANLDHPEHRSRL